MEGFEAVVKGLSRNKKMILTSGVVSEIQGSTCTVTRDGLTELLEVRFNAVEKELTSHVTITPKINSPVICGIIEDTDEAFILATSEIEKVEVVFDGHAVTTTSDGTVYDEGENSGMVKAPELVTQLNKLSARVDGIISAIENGVPIPQDGGVGFQATMVAAITAIVEVEDFTAIENPKIKH